ncbi:hypothetical protein D9M73_230850 [compost metagenome]
MGVMAQVFGQALKASVNNRANGTVGREVAEDENQQVFHWRSLALTICSPWLIQASLIAKSAAAGTHDARRAGYSRT